MGKLGRSSHVEVNEQSSMKNNIARNLHNEKCIIIDASGSPNSCLISIGKQKFRSLVDSGAEVSLMHERVFKSLKNRPKLMRKSINLQTAGHTPLNVLGCVNVDITIGGTVMCQEFIVTSELN